MLETKLSLWLNGNNCFVKKNDTKTKKTHVCLDGGVLSVPDHKMDEFWELYTNGVKNDDSFFICECVDEVIHMFCDLDFLGYYPDLKTVITVLNEVVERYYGQTFKVVILESPEKKVVKKSQEHMKKGVHVVWTNLFITPQNAVSLSRQFVKALESKIGQRNDINPWSDVIDANVYTSSLRMIGSKKMQSGKVIDSVYSYSFAIPETGIDFPCKWSSLRVWNGETLTPLREPLPVEKIKEKQCDDKLFLAVQEFIQKQTIKEWDRSLKQLTKNNDKMYVAKLDKGMHCMNAGREHHSCGIYFIFTKEGMVQRCFCRCNEVRQHGLCKDFKSKVFPISATLYHLLFQTVKPTTRKKKSKTTTGTDEMYPSNLLMKSSDTLDDYLRMSYLTILDIEKRAA